MNKIKKYLIIFIISILTNVLVYLIGNETSKLNILSYYYLFIFSNLVIIESSILYLDYFLKNKNKNNKFSYLYISIIILFTILAVLVIVYIDYPLKWLLLIPIFISHILPYFIYRYEYLYTVLPIIFYGFYFVIDQNINKIYVILLVTLLIFGLIYYFKHKKTKIYTYDNYD